MLQADATKSASATVTINPLPGPQIAVSPANATVVAGGSLQFSAVVQNGPPAVIWEVNGMTVGDSTVGFISSSGFYTAPAQIPTPAVVTIKAILLTDLLVFGTASVLIVPPPPPSVSISPTTANVVAGKTLQFSASVQNSKAVVIWQVNGVPGGDPTVGTVTSSVPYIATYTAPQNISPSSTPFTVTVTAVLQTNPPPWRNDNSLTGQNGQETTLTPSTVSPTTFGKLFGCAVDGPIFAQPLYVANVAIPSQGTHNVLYVATEHDSVYAFDADANSCQMLWQVSFLNSALAVTTVPATDISDQTDIVPEIGITGTPVIDPNTATLYVVSKTKVTANGLVVYKQELHALDLTTGWVGGIAGAEKFRGPAIIKATVSGTGDGSLAGEISFDPLKENQRSALLLAQGSVYIAFDSYDDTQPFHGWLFAFNAGDLKTPPAAFLSTPNGSNGGIGESGAAPSSDATGNVFVITSDGTFDANSGGNNYAETLLKLQMSSPSPVEDYFTPWNQATLNLTHKNFGSTGVLLLPDLAGSTTHPHLAVAGSQAGSLYLVDRYSLGGFSSTPGVDNVVQTLCFGASLTGTPAYWDNNNTPTVYVAASDDNLKAFPLAAGTFSSPSCSSGSAVPTSHSADTFPLFGASAVISSNGPAGGIIWALDTSGYATSAPAVLHAYDATNLGTELYASPLSGSGAAGIAVKFAVPTVANGKVYVGTQVVAPSGTQGELSVFGLLP